MSRKTNRLLIIIIAIAVLLLIVSNAIIGSLRNTLIIYLGTSGSDFVSKLILVLLGITSMCLGGLVVMFIRQPKEKVGFKVDGGVRKRIEAAVCLMSSFKMNHNNVHWNEVAKIKEDVTIVLNFYLSLNDLVMDEKYAALYDTDDILEAVLNSMLQHIVQLDRYYQVMYTSDPGSFFVECTKCYERIHTLRTNAQDFVQSVLKYMNDTDVSNDKEALAHIQGFKDVILGEVDLADKYIKGE